MPATSVRPFDLSKAIVTRKIVFVHQVRDGKDVYVLQPYLLVSYNRRHQASGSGQANGYDKEYYQPIGHMFEIPRGNQSLQVEGNDEQTTGAVEVSFDEIVILENKDTFAPNVGGR